MKTYSNRQEQWNKTYGGLLGESLYSLVQTTDGGYALGGVIAKAKRIDEDQILVFISSITVQEYLRGIYYKFHSDEDLFQKKLYAAESDLARFQTIDFDYQIAKTASTIDADLTIDSKQVGLADVIIGATAKFYDLIILTRNSDHFNRINNLK